MSWDKYSLTGKTKAKQDKKFIHHFPWGGAAFQPCPGQQGSFTWQWLGKTNTIALNIPPFLLPPALYAENDTLWSHGQLGSASCAIPASSQEAEKASMLNQHWSAIAETSLCYQHCSQHKSEAQPQPVTVKTINSTLAKTNTNSKKARLSHSNKVKMHFLQIANRIQTLRPQWYKTLSDCRTSGFKH